MTQTPQRLSLPRRWSRAKRKAVRAVRMAALWRAWYWANLTEAMKGHLDRVWADPPQSIDWASCGFAPGCGHFVDDAEFLP